MGHILAVTYRIMSIPVNLFLIIASGGFIYQMNSGINAYFMGLWGALLLLFLVFWIVNNIILLLQTRKVMKRHKKRQSSDFLDDDLVEVEAKIEAFPAAMFWLISSIIIGMLMFLSGILGVANILDVMRSIAEENSVDDAMRRLVIISMITMIVLTIYSALQVFHAIWILVIMRKGGAWEERSFGRS